MKKLSTREARALDNLSPGTQKGKLGERIRQLEENASPPPSLLPKVIEIGDWNMDTESTKSVLHGLGDRNRIRSVQVIIRGDPGGFYDNIYNPLAWNVEALITDDFGIQRITDADVLLSRRSGSAVYDGNSFDQTSFNRGWVTIWYES